MAFAVSAVVAAVAAPTLVSVLGAVAAVGAVTSVVGLVTGKQNLVKIGGELGLIGGLGGLAAGALSGTAAAGLGEAGVAEGAAAGAYSDVAGEQFALSQGMDAAGSGFGAANAANAANSAGIINGAQAATSAAPGASLASNVNSTAPMAAGVQAPPIDSSLAGAGVPDLQLPMPDASAPAAATTTPQSLSDSNLSDAYSDVSGEKFAIANGGNANGSMSALDKIKNTLGDGWSKLSPQLQAELAKSALAIPGGIQNQKNMNEQLDLARQRVNQTSHGSEVPTFGIINKAMKG